MGLEVIRAVVIYTQEADVNFRRVKYRHEKSFLFTLSCSN
jgi:hypothetical protein